MTLFLAQAATSFIAPALAAAGVAAIAIPIAIHLLSRTRRKSEPWGAMRFLLAAYRQHKRRLRLEQWLLLAVRCAILAVLGLALSAPLVAGLSSWLGGAGASGRTVDLVIDNSLSTRAHAANQPQRFKKLTTAAISIIHALAPQDRVALYAAATPQHPIIAQPTQDHRKVIDAIKAMRPGFTGSDVPAAMADVANRLKQNHTPADQAIMVVLSDFPRGADYLNHVMPASAAAAGQYAKIIVAKPAASATNIQLTTLTPHRRTILAEGQNQVRVPLQLIATRFGSTSNEAAADIALKLMDSAGQVLAQSQRPIHWTTGQSKITQNIALAAQLPQAALASNGQTGLIVQATIEPQNTSDAVAADNRRWAAVTVRQHLRAAVVSASQNTTGLSAADWLTLALSPGEGAVQVTHPAPSQIDAKHLQHLDAAFIVRPDLLSQKSWSALAAFARRGGLVWITAPAGHTAATWVQPMKRAFAVNWRIGLEAVQVKDATLDPQLPAPEALQLLAADWPQLLAPVRVTRRLPLTADQSERWLQLTGVTSDGDTLLAGHAIGAGELVFLATAIDPSWTNLETKPLFVPLIHETLRSVVGQAHGREGSFIAGQTLELGPRWAGVKHLQRAPWANIMASPSTAPPTASPVIPLTTKASATASPHPVTQPGVYQALSNQPPQLIVNVDASAGDTQAVSRDALAHWLTGLGAGHWAFLDWSNPGAAVEQTIQRVNLSWPLLWAVLALVIIETLLARRFSHAALLEHPSWLSTLKRASHRAKPQPRTLKSNRVTSPPPYEPLEKEEAA